MTSLLKKYSSKLLNIGDRSRNIFSHVLHSFAYKMGSIVLGFLMVPLALSYLGSESYGIWLTVSSILTWLLLFDFGLGNGLRNEFAAKKNICNTQDLKKLVSTTYFITGLIVVVLIVVIFVVSQFIDWGVLLNAPKAMSEMLNTMVPVLFSLFFIQLFFKLIVNIYQGDEHHSIVNKTWFWIQSLTLGCIGVLAITETSSLVLFGTIYTFAPILVYIGINIHSFSSKYKNIKPSINCIEKKKISALTSTGMQFLILQISHIALMTTDNVIISHVFSPGEVSSYQIVLKYFSVSMLIFSIIANPYWSSITQAASKKEFKWIEKSVVMLQKVWIASVILTLIQCMFFKPVINLWVGNSITIPEGLVIQAMIFSCLQAYNMIYTYSLNGLGKLKLQVYVGMITIVTNVPMSIFLAKNMGMGVSGILLATNINLLLYIVTKKIEFNIYMRRQKSVAKFIENNP